MHRSRIPDTRTVWQRIATAAIAGAASVPRVLRNAIKPRPGRFLIVPPASEGGVGDDAMVSSLARALCQRGARQITMIAHASSDGYKALRSDLRDVTFEIVPLPKSQLARARLVWRIRGYEQVYILGADILDGAYRVSKTLATLRFADLAQRAGIGTTIVGFSYNEHPDPECAALLRSLPEEVRLCCRDPRSYERVAQLTGHEPLLTADIAFLLAPNENYAAARPVFDFVESQRSAGRAVIGMNLNRMTYHRFPDVTAGDLVERWVAAVEELVAGPEQFSIVLLPHDARGAESDLEIARRTWEGLSSAARARVVILAEPMRADCVKAVVGRLDCVITGRMHIAIASLGCGTPVTTISYQGKAEGLYDYFGLPELVLSTEGSLAPQALPAATRRLYADRVRSASAIRQHLPRVMSLSRRNLAGNEALPPDQTSALNQTFDPHRVAVSLADMQVAATNSDV